MIKIFAKQSFEYLRDAIVRSKPETFSRGEITWKKFKDKTPNFFVKDYEKLAYDDLVFITSLSDTSEYFDQLAAYIWLARARRKSFHLVLTYSGVATMERVIKPGEVATASILSRMLGDVPADVLVSLFDIHAEQNEFYFPSNLRVVLKSWMKKMLRSLPKDIVLVCPDDGCYKRFKTFFTDDDGKPIFDIVLCYKERFSADPSARKIRIVEGQQHIPGRVLWMIDDIIHSGSTAIACLDVLKGHDPAEVNFLATHAVMEDGAYTTIAKAGFNKIMISDSVPETAALVKYMSPFETHSIMNKVIETITDGIVERSSK